MLRLLGVWMLLGCVACAAGWKPVVDETYLQEVGRQVPTEAAVNAVAVLGEEVFCGFDTGLRRLGAGDALEPVAGAPAGPILRLEAVNGALLAFTDVALHRFRDGQWVRLAAGRYYDACDFQGRTIVLSETQLFAVDGDALTALPGADAPVKMRAVAAYAETLYCLGLDRLMIYDGKSIEFSRVADFGMLPSKDARDILPVDNRLLVATYFGMGVLRGAALTGLLGVDGLPYAACTALAPGFAGDYWIATPHGAVRAVGDEFHVFNGARWLPNDDVQAIATGKDAAYIATRGGLGIVRYVPCTLAAKADYYERHLVSMGQKRMAFTHELHWDDAKKQWLREISDNDLGWSTHHWSAQAFKYAATGDPAARRAAIDGFNALKWSEEITSIDGYPARAIWAVGETGIQAMHGSGGYDAEWHPAEDARFEWKGDTSSDEIDAQIYCAAIMHDLIDDDTVRAKAKEHIARIVGHIVAHNYQLIDVDGQPTVWGRWDPDYFASWKGMYASGLNGLEMLAYATTAAVLTGEPRFTGAVADLVAKGYPAYTIAQKHTVPAAFVNHSDDRLAFYAYLPLLNYEKDPALRGYYRRSLERSWEIERIEKNPWFNFIYGKLTGSDCEVAASVDHLRAWPLDLRSHSWDQTKRDDLAPPPGYQAYAGEGRAVSPRERGGMRWSDNGVELRGGGGGRTVRDPSGWLEAYWMGRCYGMILPPPDGAPLTLPVEAPTDGATPYDGPAMPDVLGLPAVP